jgi:hypothetical protein
MVREGEVVSIWVPPPVKPLPPEANVGALVYPRFEVCSPTTLAGVLEGKPSTL